MDSMLNTILYFYILILYYIDFIGMIKELNKMFWFNQIIKRFGEYEVLGQVFPSGEMT